MPRQITAETNVDELLTWYPEVATVFLSHKLLCVGCPISRHHMLCDCAAENSIDLDVLLADLNQAVSEARSSAADGER